MDVLRNHIEDLKEKIKDLKEELAQSERKLRDLENGIPDDDVVKEDEEMRIQKDVCEEVERLNVKLGENYVFSEADVGSGPVKTHEPYVVVKFSKSITERYSRQIILDQIGVEGQEKLLNASVLIIGCGGIGSPCIQYLAACGVGTLGLVDYDAVELSNLHRQVIHSTETLGRSKVASAKAYIASINSEIQVNTYEILLDASNAFDIVRRYDVILDACDNAPTRYLVNDACLVTDRPLISASALGFAGQLCVYNHKDAPCYRCIYPVPPPPETVGSCSENGVLGPVPGLMGTLQAVETIKLIVGLPVLDKLLVYDAETTKFLSVKLRPKKPDCICANRTEVKLIDYELFCASNANDKTPSISLLRENDHMSVQDYHDVFLKFNIQHLLLDVRSAHEFDMVHLRHSAHVDIQDIDRMVHLDPTKWPSHFESVLEHILSYRNIFVICRRGNDSQKVVLLLSRLIERRRNISPGVNREKSTASDLCSSHIIKNIKEGYYGWRKYIDKNMPIY